MLSASMSAPGNVPVSFAMTPNDLPVRLLPFRFELLLRASSSLLIRTERFEGNAVDIQLPQSIEALLDRQMAITLDGFRNHIGRMREPDREIHRLTSKVTAIISHHPA
jgi:hypothetical protein